MSEAIKPPKKMTATLRNTWRVRKAWDEEGWEIYPDYKTTFGEPCEVARTTDAHKAPRWVAELLADAGNTYNTTGLTPRQLVERVKELEDTLCSLAGRFLRCAAAGISAAEAYDSFYRDDVTEVLSKALPNAAAKEAGK